MRPAFRKWDNMVFRQTLHVAIAVHTTMAIGRKNFAPLRGGQIVDGCTSFACPTSVISCGNLRLVGFAIHAAFRRTFCLVRSIISTTSGILRGYLLRMRETIGTTPGGKFPFVGRYIGTTPGGKFHLVGGVIGAMLRRTFRFVDSIIGTTPGGNLCFMRRIVGTTPGSSLCFMRCIVGAFLYRKLYFMRRIIGAFLRRNFCLMGFAIGAVISAAFFGRVWHGSNLRCWLRVMCGTTRRKRAFGLQTLVPQTKYTESISCYGGVALIA